MFYSRHCIYKCIHCTLFLVLLDLAMARSSLSRQLLALIKRNILIKSRNKGQVAGVGIHSRSVSLATGRSNKIWSFGRLIQFIYRVLRGRDNLFYMLVFLKLDWNHWMLPDVRGIFQPTIGLPLAIPMNQPVSHDSLLWTVCNCRTV